MDTLPLFEASPPAPLAKASEPTGRRAARKPSSKPRWSAYRPKNRVPCDDCLAVLVAAEGGRHSRALPGGSDCTPGPTGWFARRTLSSDVPTTACPRWTTPTAGSSDVPVTPAPQPDVLAAALAFHDAEHVSVSWEEMASEQAEYEAAPAAASTANRGLTRPLATDETGGLTPMMVPASLHDDKTPEVARFFGRVQEDPSGCWLWTGYLQRGYGRVSVKGQFFLAHRYSWLVQRGPIPDGLQLDHLCRVRNCVRIDHLEPVTNRVNSLRATGKAAINAAKTHCHRGHEFDEANTYLNPAGRRECIPCRQKRDRARYLRKTGQAA